MSEFNSNYEIAPAVSEGIGASPVPFDSVYSITSEIYNKLGGEPAEFDSVYSILLAILPLVGGGTSSNVIDDNVTTTVKTWSSSKISSLLDESQQGKLTAGDNITISDNTISAKGYYYDDTKNSFATQNTVAYGENSHSEGQFLSKPVNGAVFSVPANGTTLTLNTSSIDLKGLVNVGDVISVNLNNETLYRLVKSVNTSNKTFTIDSALSTSDLTNLSINIVSAISYGAASHAEGIITTAGGKSSHAEGSSTRAGGDYSHAEGMITTASGNYSHAEGYNTKASGNYSHAEGDNNTASGESSHAEGYNTKAYGSRSHAEGASTTASGEHSHAEGGSTTAGGKSSHAEGFMTSASGDYSHAEGVSTRASGYKSHAEGPSTGAGGNCSHAEGYSTSAASDFSHAEGLTTTASGYCSHAEGKNTTAQNNSEHAEGYSNVSHKASDTYGDAGNTQHSVGISEDENNRKNAFEIMQNGDMYVYGIGGYVGTNTTVQDSTIKTLQAYIASLEARIAALEPSA